MRYIAKSLTKICVLLRKLKFVLLRLMFDFGKKSKEYTISTEDKNKDFNNPGLDINIGMGKFLVNQYNTYKKVSAILRELTILSCYLRYVSRNMLPGTRKAHIESTPYNSSLNTKNNNLNLIVNKLQKLHYFLKDIKNQIGELPKERSFLSYSKPEGVHDIDNEGITIIPLEYTSLLMYLPKSDLMRDINKLVEKYNSDLKNLKNPFESVEGIFFNPDEGRENDIRIGGFPFVKRTLYSEDGRMIFVLLPVPWDYLSPSERNVVKKYYIIEKGSEFRVKIPAICLSIHKKIYAQGLLEIPHGSGL